MIVPIEIVKGRGLPLPGNDIDTDQIIESRYLKMTTFDGIEAHAFESLRKLGQHPFDDPRFAGATVLLVGRNFGCGSSREHAPQALYRFGIRAIIGESFGEIFAGNCFAIGLPCLMVSADKGSWLRSAASRDPSMTMTVDIATCTVTAGSRTIAFDLPAGRRCRLLDGSWDSLSVLMNDRLSIEAKLASLPQIAVCRSG